MEDVAIVGMACIFPGAPDLETYWENIVAKLDCTSDPPPEWEPDLYFDPEHKSNDRTYCKRGGYLGDLARFDPFELGVMPNSLDGGEPDHFLSLRVANEALADAGYSRHTIDSHRTEVIVGRGTYINRGITNMFQHGVVVDQTLDIIKDLHPEYTGDELAKIKARLKERLPPLTAETIASLVPNVLSGRIANRLNLMGGNYIVDAACASSLLAVEQGINDLVVGKCDMAIVGGVNASLPPPILMIFSQIDALSRRQQLRAFDADADGTLLGEGLGFVILKRRVDAERDGDRIYANLKGVGVASDGRVHGLLAPWVEGQALAIRRAYQAAGTSPANVGLVECHGTGVPLGDKTEMQSLRRVFGPRVGERASCGVGTVKSMIGHLLTAAGMAGLIKTVLSLHHKVLPPTLGCDRPNPELELEKSPFYINTETRPWIHGDQNTPRQAAVNAFGFGGINAHAILEEHVEPSITRARVNLNREWDVEVFLVRASSRAKLIERVDLLNRLLESERPVLLRNLAFTLNTGADAGDVCLSIVAGTRDDLNKKLLHAAKRLRDEGCKRINDRSGIYFFEEPLGAAGRVAFLMPGEGSQYENMLSDLCVHFPEVRGCFDLLDRAFFERKRSYLPSHTIFPLPLGADGAEDRLWAMDSAAESVFAANQAMQTMMGLLGVAPDVYLGHSTGEYSALLAAGVIHVADEAGYIDFVLGVNAVYEGLAAEGRIAAGVLLTVGAADSARIRTLIDESAGQLYMAMENCPNQVVLCGTEAAIAAAEGVLRGEGAMCLRLPFSRAYHTPLFQDVCDALHTHFGGLDIRPASTDVYSCITGAPYPEEPDAIRALATSQWASTVRFDQSIEQLYADGVRVFIEVGPRSNLSAFVSDILRKRRHLSLATNLHTRSGISQINHVVGQLAAHHVAVDPAILYAHRATQRMTLTEPDVASPMDGTVEHLRRIDTVLPRMRLGSPPVLDRKRVSEPAAEPLAAPPPASAAGADPIAAGAAVPTVGTNGAPTSSVDERGRIMAEYLRGMEDFLTANDRVMRSLLARGGSAPAASAENRATPAASAATSVSTRVHARPGMAPGQHPFIRTVIEVTSERAIALCRLDLEEDLYLRDHTLGGRAVSKADPDLCALPILPLTFTMEVMCEGAALLLPHGQLVGMREVRGYRWIALDRQQPKTLQVVATAVSFDTAAPVGSAGEVKVQVRELEEGSDAASVKAGLPLAEATVFFAAERPAAPAAPRFDLKDRRESKWTGRELYDGFMFHGHSLRSVASVEAWGENGSEATLQAMPEEPLFRSRTKTSFLSDAVVLDGAGQAVAYWTSDHLASGYHVFPFRLEEMRVYGPPLEVPERAACVASIALVGEEQTRSDIAIVGPDGRVRIHLDGWWDRRFEMPAAFARFLGRPADEQLSSAWPELPAPLADVGACACLVERPSVDFFTTHDGLWERVVAHVVLSRVERDDWAQRAQNPQRIAWLLGRVAAKDAVRALVKRRLGADVLPADIELANDEHGRPLVTAIAGVSPDALPAISIAHKAGFAVAVAAHLEVGFGLGVDAESMRDLDETFLRGAFSEDERRLLARFGATKDTEGALSAWCAKEAFAKALGTGFMGKPTNVLCRELDPESHRFEMEVADHLASVRPGVAGLRMPVYALKFDEILLAACVCKIK